MSSILYLQRLSCVEWFLLLILLNDEPKMIYCMLIEAVHLKYVHTEPHSVSAMAVKDRGLRKLKFSNIGPWHMEVVVEHGPGGWN